MNAISRKSPHVRMSTEAFQANLDVVQKMFEEHGRNDVIDFLIKRFRETFGLEMAMCGNTSLSEGYILTTKGEVAVNIDPCPTRDETENTLLKVMCVIVCQCCDTQDMRPFTDGDVVIITEGGPEECPCYRCCGVFAG